ncbi:MAG: hypothetical protein RLZZ237_1687 [Pseudomonadota bacterium]|jgi:hypothetical protein
MNQSPLLSTADIERLLSLETQEVVLLAKQVQPVLESYGLTRVLKEQLAEPLASHFRVPTILADEEFTQFDALFYWAD